MFSFEFTPLEIQAGHDAIVAKAAEGDDPNLSYQPLAEASVALLNEGVENAGFAVLTQMVLDGTFAMMRQPSVEARLSREIVERKLTAIEAGRLLGELGVQSVRAHLISHVNCGVVIFFGAGDVRFSRQPAQMLARGVGRRNGAKLFFEASFCTGCLCREAVDTWRLCEGDSSIDDEKNRDDGGDELASYHELLRVFSLCGNYFELRESSSRRMS